VPAESESPSLKPSSNPNYDRQNVKHDQLRKPDGKPIDQPEEGVMKKPDRKDRVVPGKIRFEENPDWAATAFEEDGIHTLNTFEAPNPDRSGLDKDKQPTTKLTEPPGRGAHDYDICDRSRSPMNHPVNKGDERTLRDVLGGNTELCKVIDRVEELVWIDFLDPAMKDQDKAEARLDNWHPIFGFVPARIEAVVDSIAKGQAVKIPQLVNSLFEVKEKKENPKPMCTRNGLWNPAEILHAVQVTP